MKKMVLIIMVIFFTGMIRPNHCLCQVATLDEASVIAHNWIVMVIDKYGHWGNGETAYAEPIQEFRSKDRLIGYFCNVHPKGFIVISLRKEFAPVKAYSDRHKLDPTIESDMTELIKFCMARIIDTIESNLGFIEVASTSDIAALIEIDYRQSWDYIQNYSPGTISKNLYIGDNYQEGDFLLSSEWDQHPPYNNDCPDMGCSNSNGNAVVGCVATAGAQIMRYYNWPPYGEGSPYDDSYDWINMPDDATDSSPSAQQAAVAELCQEVGEAVDMVYGCAASGGSVAFTYNMVGVYKDHFRYHTSCTTAYRNDYNSASDWFDLIVDQININCPIQYRIPGHSIVCDGWQLIGSLKQYHMNYGGSVSSTNWYTLDELVGGNIAEEYMVYNIFPTVSLGEDIHGYYATLSFPYRYFNRDAFNYGSSGVSAIFQAGQYLQFLPEVKVKATGSSTYLEFQGNPGDPTQLYTAGNMGKGIKISKGAIRHTNGGTVKLY
jgi:hypothetical protein